MFGMAHYKRDGNAFAGIRHDSLIVPTAPDTCKTVLQEAFFREFQI
jgi:hypothetical protein